MKPFTSWYLGLLFVGAANGFNLYLFVKNPSAWSGICLGVTVAALGSMLLSRRN